jgi:endonuclease G, mitochondrial
MIGFLKHCKKMDKKTILQFVFLFLIILYPTNQIKLGANNKHVNNVKSVNQIDCLSHDVKIFLDSILLEGLEIPYYDSSKQVVYHFGFTLEYNENHEQANWVAYRLSKQKLIKVAQRTDKFIEDPSIQSGSATNLDYLKSGYDRGHLAPAADMAWSIQAMRESFYFSNMSPQLPSFNRGIWKNLEEQVRKWADEKGELFIVTGPVLEDSLPYIGINKVSIPKLYYKVILQIDSSTMHALGFLIPNENSTKPFSDYLVSVDSVEKITGINFFHHLPDSIEDKLEKQICLTYWLNNNTSSNTNDTIQTKYSPIKCMGITQKGNGCKNNAKKGKSYCKLHEP